MMSAPLAFPRCGACRGLAARVPSHATLVFTFTLVVFHLACSAQAASFVVEKASLQIVDPPSLQGKYDTAIGDFGVPKYGAKLVGEVVHDKSNGEGCQLFKEPYPKAKGAGHATFFLIDRGDCFFIEKSWHAQLAGANAVLVVDNVDEDLLTMANPSAGQGGSSITELAKRIDIPSALVKKTVGDEIKKALAMKTVIVTLDWSDSIANPDARVEWELWTTSNTVCGAACDRSVGFVNEMKVAAQTMEQTGAASFSPHFLSWSCVDSFDPDLACPSLCVNHGRYCAPDPVEGADVDAATVDLVRKNGYSGKDTVEENLRQLCIFNELKSTNLTSEWWTYATRHFSECKMTAGTFNRVCAEEILAYPSDEASNPGLGFDQDAIQRVRACVGDLTSDKPNKLMDRELKLQSDADDSGRGAVVLVPTVVINLDQYRGRLTGRDVLAALCAGFAEEGAQPDVCLQNSLETNECLSPGNAGCWSLFVPADKSPLRGKNFTACVDTFRGYRCECPSGFSGDGVTCQDIDECEEAKKNDETDLCEHICVNEIGDYKCACRSGFKLIGGVSCLPVSSFGSKHRGMGFGDALFVTFTVLFVVCLAFFAAYKYVLKQRIDGEVRAIMADYMPLEDRDRDSSGDGPTGGFRPPSNGFLSRRNADHERDTEFGGTKLEDMHGGPFVR